MIKLYYGDCLDILPNIESASINLILADMPYGTTKCKWDSCIPLEPLWEQVERIAVPRAAIILTAQTPFDKVLGASNLEMLRYEWIWEKGNATGFLNSKKMPLKAHENVLVFYKKLPTYNPQFTHGHPRKQSKRKTVNSECYGKALQLVEYDSTDRYPRSVQFFSSDKQKSNLHESQKPLAMMEYMVKTYSNPGDTVLDFCMGSGTTGAACLNTGRNFIGIEKGKEQYLTARNRLFNHENVNNLKDKALVGVLL